MQLAGTAARFTGSLLAGGVIAAVALAALFAALGTLVFSPVAGLGLPFLAVMTWLVRPLAGLERRRVQWVTGTAGGRRPTGRCEDRCWPRSGPC